jgi:hypothetical protein
LLSRREEKWDRGQAQRRNIEFIEQLMKIWFIVLISLFLVKSLVWSASPNLPNGTLNIAYRKTPIKAEDKSILFSKLNCDSGECDLITVVFECGSITKGINAVPLAIQHTSTKDNNLIVTAIDSSTLHVESILEGGTTTLEYRYREGQFKQLELTGFSGGTIFNAVSESNPKASSVIYSPFMGAFPEVEMPCKKITFSGVRN